MICLPCVRMLRWLFSMKLEPALNILCSIFMPSAPTAKPYQLAARSTLQLLSFPECLPPPPPTGGWTPGKIKHQVLFLGQHVCLGRCHHHKGIQEVPASQNSKQQSLRYLSRAWHPLCGYHQHHTHHDEKNNAAQGLLKARRMRYNWLDIVLKDMC